MDAESANGAGRAPVLMVRHGRGRTGGTTFLDWAIQRARLAGRPILIGDGDRRNATLARLYPPDSPGGASQPETDDTAKVIEWIRTIVSRAAVERVSVALDLGAGDQALAEGEREINLIEFCSDYGLDSLFVGTMGPDMDDFDHLLAILRSGTFSAQRILFLFNLFLVRRGKTSLDLFKPIVMRPEMQDLVKAGARTVVMPSLLYLEEMRRHGLSVYDAAAGKCRDDGAPVDPMWQFAAKTFLKTMEKELRSNGCEGWLP